MYHLVFPAKYRRKVISKAVEISLRDICLKIGRHYEIYFVEIGMEEDHVHFLVQSIPTLTVSRIITIIKSITAREIFKSHKEVKKELWGAALWTSGHYANTVGQFASAEVIKKYVANQGREYRKLYSAQLKFDF